MDQNLLSSQSIVNKKLYQNKNYMTFQTISSTKRNTRRQYSSLINTSASLKLKQTIKAPPEASEFGTSYSPQRMYLLGGGTGTNDQHSKEKLVMDVMNETLQKIKNSKDELKYSSYISKVKIINDMKAYLAANYKDMD